MVTAVVMLNVTRNKINDVAEKLADMAGITEVYSVAGQYDLCAVIRVKDNEDMADLVTRKLLQVDGITKSETLIAFRVYSRHDLEAMFSIGEKGNNRSIGERESLDLSDRDAAALG